VTIVRQSAICSVFRTNLNDLKTTAALLLTVPIVSSAPDVLLLLGMLMLGMALGALLTHIRHKAQTARIVQELEAKFAQAEGEKHDPTKPDAVA